MKLYQGTALLWVMSRAYAVVEAACDPTVVTVQIQPYKIICSGVTRESTSTRTLQNCETPPPDTIVTVTGTCAATTSCKPVTVPPPADCTHPCTTTITTYPPGTLGVPTTTLPPPDQTITTEGICTETTPCVPVTNPPPADCTHPCTTTVTTYPPSSPPLPSSTVTPPPDVITTVGGICTETTPCPPVTNSPPADCTHPCTTTVTTYPPPSSTPFPSSTLTTPPDVIITVGGTCTETTSCPPVTNPPPADCTHPCTTTVTTYPVSSSTPLPSSISTPSSSSAPTPSSSSSSTPPATTPTSTPESSSSTSTSTPTSSTPPVPTLRCDRFGYLIQDQTLYRVNISTGVTTQVRDQVGPVGQVNAIGYNTQDNYLYGIARNGTANVLLQIGGDGSSKVIASNIPDTNNDYNAGDFTADGHLWISSGGNAWAEIDLSDPTSSTYGMVINSGDATDSRVATGSGLVYDWVSLPSYPGSLYALTVANPNTYLLAWSTSTHEWSLVKNYGAIDGAGAIGAAYSTNNGTFYAMGNQSGNVFAVNVGDPDEEPTVVSTAPQSSLNDGARCQLASEV